jgi:hypothetical protein
MAGQVGNLAAFVFPVWHFAGQQQEQVFGFHGGATLANLVKEVG